MGVERRRNAREPTPPPSLDLFCSRPNFRSSFVRERLLHRQDQYRCCMGLPLSVTAFSRIYKEAPSCYCIIVLVIVIKLSLQKLKDLPFLVDVLSRGLPIVHCRYVP